MTGVEREDRLAELADDVHRAHQEEAHRRVRRHRAIVVLVFLGCLLTTAVTILVLSGRGDGGSADLPAPGGARVAGPAAAATSTTGAASTTTTGARPAAAPPAGIAPDPASVLVLLDRERRLPPGWAPDGLVVPAMAWATTDAVERRLLRPEAAAAIDRLAVAAARDGVPLLGISGFRSEQSQRQVHDRYVRQEGEAAARTFSATPGHSEHQTGLAVDVTGADGTCPAEPCFGAAPQAAWLAQHAPEFGFIVRYPAGKEQVTTFDAEPWHLRFVGVEPALEMQRLGLTLDEYLRAA